MMRLRTDANVTLLSPMKGGQRGVVAAFRVARCAWVHRGGCRYKVGKVGLEYVVLRCCRALKLTFNRERMRLVLKIKSACWKLENKNCLSITVIVWLAARGAVTCARTVWRLFLKRACVLRSWRSCDGTWGNAAQWSLLPSWSIFHLIRCFWV